MDRGGLTLACLTGGAPAAQAAPVATTLIYRIASGDVYASDQIVPTADPLAVPEPAALALFGAGLLGLAAARRRR